MDPVCMAISALFNFLATPAGQQFCGDVRSVDQGFNKKVADLFNKLHSQIGQVAGQTQDITK